MRLIIPLLLIAFVVAFSGCANDRGKSSPPPAAPAAKPVVRASDALAGRVVSSNPVARFAVLNFPVTHVPAINQTFYAYRDGLKVGELKITGPQKDDNIVADVVNGEAKAGDEVRDR
jgi:hypothetical protein